MAIRLSNGAEFLHIPKTGGSWVTAVLKANNLIDREYSHMHANYDYNLLDPTFSGKENLLRAVNKVKKKFFGTSSAPEAASPIYRFCFVRHPLSWYESWWKYVKGINWTRFGEENSGVKWHPNSILNGLGSDDFNEFVWNVVQKRPGYVSELYFSYTKPGISFIGKNETLAEDLTHVLHAIGLDISEDSIKNHSKQNVSKTPSSAIEWDPKLRETVLKLELPALVHFDYLTEEEKESFNIPPHPKLHRSPRQ